MSLTFAPRSKARESIAPESIAPDDSNATENGAVPFTCRDIWTLASFAYDSTLVHDDAYQPDRGAYAELITDIGGFACAYTSPRNGNRITLAVATSDDPLAFVALEAHIAATSTQVLSFGPPSEIQVFKVRGVDSNIADYEIFLNGYWISATSNLFHTPNGATALIQALVQTLSCE